MPAEDQRDDRAEFQFEPSSWDIAVAMGIAVDSEADQRALAELVDAMLVGLEGPELDRLAERALDDLRSDRIETIVREALAELRTHEGWETAVVAAEDDLARKGPRAAVCREVACHLAMQLGQADLPEPFFCLHCFEEAAARVTGGRRRAIALEASAIVSHGVGGSWSARSAARARLARLAQLGRSALPTLAGEWRAILASPAPAQREADEVWRAGRASARAASAYLN